MKQQTQKTTRVMSRRDRHDWVAIAEELLAALKRVVDNAAPIRKAAPDCFVLARDDLDAAKAAIAKAESSLGYLR